MRNDRPSNGRLPLPYRFGSQQFHEGENTMTSDTDAVNQRGVEQAIRYGGRRVLLTVVVLSIVAVEPAAAQSNPVCEADGLSEIVSGFFQLTTGIGLIGFVVVWQADSLVEMFTVSPDHRERLKRHKRIALKSTVILLVLGPLFTVAGSTMGLPLAECVDLVPW